VLVLVLIHFPEQASPSQASRVLPSTAPSGTCTPGTLTLTGPPLSVTDAFRTVVTPESLVAAVGLGSGL